MIEELVAQNYGCLRDVRVKLTPLHALIGPNDSGKSTILRAIRTLSQLAHSQFANPDRIEPFDPALVKGARLQLTPQGGGSFQISSLANDSLVESYDDPSWKVESRARNLFIESRLDDDGPAGIVRPRIRRAHYAALAEEGLRAPSGFMPPGQRFLSVRGEGLPGVYFALRNDREEAFENILKKTRELFPTVKTVRTQPRSTTELELEVELTDGTRVRAAQISAGLLYFLGFAALPEFLGKNAIVLLEEPENGLHPARIAEVMNVLRRATEQSTTQIIMATHSPLVVNELRPEEVSIVTRQSVETGTVVTPIADTPNFEERSSVYALGELWLSYADGRIEQALLDPAAQ